MSEQLVATWQATHDGSNLTATVDLCQSHGDEPGRTIPDPLPVPVRVERGLHRGSCEWCDLLRYGADVDGP